MPRYGEGSVVGQSYEPSRPPGAGSYLLGAGAGAAGAHLVRRAVAPGVERRSRALALKQVKAQGELDAKVSALASAKVGQRGRARSQVDAAQRSVSSVSSRMGALHRATPKLLSGAHRVKVGAAGVGLSLAGLGVLANTVRRPQA